MEIRMDEWRAERGEEASAFFLVWRFDHSITVQVLPEIASRRAALHGCMCFCAAGW